LADVARLERSRGFAPAARLVEVHLRHHSAAMEMTKETIAMDNEQQMKGYNSEQRQIK